MRRHFLIFKDFRVYLLLVRIINSKVTSQQDYFPSLTNSDKGSLNYISSFLIFVGFYCSFLKRYSTVNKVIMSYFSLWNIALLIIISFIIIFIATSRSFVRLEFPSFFENLQICISCSTYQANNHSYLPIQLYSLFFLKNF